MPKIIVELSEEDNKALQDGRIAVNTMRKVLLKGTPLNECNAEDCISRKEIEDRCKYVIEHGAPNEDGTHSITAEKLLVVVQALSSVYPTANAKDCISREEVRDEINRIGNLAFKDYSDYSNLMDFIDSLPSVYPKSDEENKNE